MSLAKYKEFIQSASAVHEYRYFPFSLPSLNRAIGNKNGIRAGRIVQFIGNQSSGKTTLALDLIANAQRSNVQCAYVDFERTFDREYSAALGVQLDSLLLVKPDYAEQGLAIIELLLKEDQAQLIVIDSIPAAVPSTESEKGYDDSEKMAVAAGYITRFCRRVVPIVDNKNALIVVLNQYRANMSTLSRSESKAYGARMLGYASSLIIDLVRIKNEDTRTIVQARATKNKLAAERGMTEFTLVYGRGIDVAQDVIMLAVELGIIEKRGVWFYFGEQKAQGIENAKIVFNIEQLQELINERT